MLNTHSLTSLPRLQLSVVLPWGPAFRRGWGVGSALFFAVITTRWLHFWFPVSWQLGCALVIWNVRIVEESLGILHVLQPFIQIHSSLTISGPSKCCVLWYSSPLSSSSRPLCRTRGSYRPRAFEVGKNEKEKSCLSFQLVLFVPKEGAEAMNLNPQWED